MTDNENFIWSIKNGDLETISKYVDTVSDDFEMILLLFLPINKKKFLMFF